MRENFEWVSNLLVIRFSLFGMIYIPNSREFGLYMSQKTLFVAHYYSCFNTGNTVYTH